MEQISAPQLIDAMIRIRPEARDELAKISEEISRVEQERSGRYMGRCRGDVGET